MMARVPSYYEQYPHSQSSSLGSYNNFAGTFASSQPPFPVLPPNGAVSATSCSTDYSQTFSYLGSTAGHTEEQNGFPCQYEFASLRECSQPDSDSCRSFLSDDASLSHMDASSHLRKENSHLSSLHSSNELDAHLSDLPLESLLHLTQPEERLIKENVVEDCMPQECSGRIFKEDQDISSRLSLHRSPSPAAASIYSSLSTSPASCSPQSSPFSPQSTSCSSQATSFSPQAASYLPQTPTTSSNSPPQLSHQAMENSAGKYESQAVLCFSKDDDTDMNSMFEDMLDDCLNITPRAEKIAKTEPPKAASMVVAKRQQHKPRKVVRKKATSSVNAAEFSPTSCHGEMKKTGSVGFLDPPQQMEARTGEGRSGVEGPDVASTSRGSVFVPPVHNTFEPKKPPPPRKRMKSSALSPEEKICGVCGDVAKNMHFGGMACDSCKAFFRRSVQSGTYESFRCEQEERCVISKANRRVCQFCRFRKCQTIGMQIEWVMTESDRMTLLKNRLAKTRQAQAEKEKDELYGNLPRNLDPENARALNVLLEDMHSAFASMPYPAECSGDNIDTLSNIFVFLCKRFGKFYFKVDDFNNICSEDRTCLLKNGIAMSLYINGAHMYDPETQSWPAPSIHETVKVPRVTLSTLQELASIPDAFATVMKFYFKYENDLKDEYISLLMYLISFFLPDDPNLLEPECVRRIQDKYIDLLKRYLIARDGWQSVSGLFMKLMDGINYIKDILKFHAIVDIKPTINHNEVATSNVSYAQPMKNLITQIQEAFKGNFSQYASVFGASEKCIAAPPGEKPGNQVVKRSSSFGPSLRTDMIITSSFQSTMEWDMSKQGTSCQLALEAPPSSSGSQELCAIASSSNLKRNSSMDGQSSVRNALCAPPDNLSLCQMRDKRRNDVSEEVTVDAVCDILKQLSHTEDKKVLRILKKNIPVELLEKFSESLKEN